MATLPSVTGTPATSTYRTGQFGALQPLLNDLLTPDQMKNKYLKQTYSGDPTAIQERLGQYNVYDTGQLGGLADYFKSQAPVATGNQLYMKPTDFESAQSKLTGLKSSELESLNPMLGGLSSIGSFGEASYYDKAKLEEALAKYQSADLTGLTGLKEFQGLNPVTSYGGKNYYEKDPLSTALGALGNYGSLGSEEYGNVSWLPELQQLNPLTEVAGTKLYDQSALKNALAGLNKYEMMNKEQYDKYSALPELAKLQTAGIAGDNRFYNQGALQSVLGQYSTLDPTKLGTDVFSNALSGRQFKVGDNSLIKTSDVDYYTNLAKGLEGSRIGYYGLNALADPYKDISYGGGFTNYPGHYLNIDGQQKIYMPYEAGAKVGYDAATDRILMLNDVAGNEDFFKYGKAFTLPPEILAQVEAGLKKQEGTNWVGHDYRYDTPGTGYLFDSLADYNKYVFNKNTVGAADAHWGPSNYRWDSGHGNVATSKQLADSWLIRNKDIDLSGVPIIGSKLESTPWVAQSESNPKNFYRYDPSNPGNSGITAYDQWMEYKKKGGFLGSFGNFMTSNPIGQILGVVADVYSGGAYSAGKALGTASQTGDWGKAIIPVASAVVGGMGGAEKLGSAVTSGALSGTQAAMLGTAIMSGAGGLAQGQSLGGALKSAALGALGTGAGSALGGALSGAVGGGALGNTLGKIGQGALSNFIGSGGNANAAMYGGLGGAMSGIGGTLGKYLSNEQGWSPTNAGYAAKAPGALAQYMLAQNKQKQMAKQAMLRRA